MNNIESINLESLINGSSLGNYSNVVPNGMALVSASDGSSMVMSNGSLGMGSNSSFSSMGSMMLSSSTGDPLMSTCNLDDLTSTSFAHHLTGSTNGSHNNAHHLNHNSTLANVTNHHHSDLHSHLTTSSNHSFLNSTSSDPINSISGSSSDNGGFNLDQFDSMDTAGGCQLLQSYSLKDDDYGTLDVDLLGMLGGTDLDEPTDNGMGDNSSITDHLTQAQYSNLLDDCLDHISSADSGLVSSMEALSSSASTSITSISTSSALNQLSTTLNANSVVVLNRKNQLGEPCHRLNHIENHVDSELQQSPSNHMGSHHHDLFSTHHHHHQFETINFADCPELTEDLADQLAAAVTCSSNEQIHTNGIVVQSANLGGISCSGEDLLTPILTTVTSSSAGVVATTTTNVGHPFGTTNDAMTDHLLMLKKDDACSSSSRSSLNPPCPKNENENDPTKSSSCSNVQPNKQQQKLSNSSTTSSLMNPPSPANGASGKGGTSTSNLPTNLDPPESPSMGKVMKEEVCRLTVCPLCDNAKSFCSSSSVTRHLRSVHKLNDLLGTRNCYCLLCARFIEDLPEFFSHLKSDHQLLQQSNPVSDLYVRHHFKSFEEFMHWKTNNLEKQTGCKYERCFTNEYPRSIYFKCSAIRITRITLAGKYSTSNKEPPAIDSNSSSKGSPSSGSETGGEKSNSNMVNEVVLESSFDARMYPCTSSIRLIFRYTGIEAIEFPYHLGHKLESNRRDLCLSHMASNAANSSNAARLPSQHVVHLNATSTTMTTVAPTSANGGSGHHPTHHIKIKSEVIPGGMVAPYNQQTPATSTTSVVNGPKTTTTNHQLVFIPSKTQQPVAQALALATGSSASVSGNANLSKCPATSAVQSASSQAKAKSPRKRNRESKSSNSSGKSKVAKVESQTVEQQKTKQHTKSSPVDVNVAQQIVTNSKVMITAPATNTTSSTSFLPSVSAGAFNSSVSFANSTSSTPSAILTAINANHTNTVTPLKGNAAGTTHLVTPITLNSGSFQADRRQSSSLSSVNSSNQQLLKSPRSTPLDPSILIDNLASDIFLDASYDTDDPTAGDSKSELKLKLETQQQAATSDSAVTALVIKSYGEDANVGLGLSTIKKEDFSSDSKDSLIMVPAATISSSATVMATGNSIPGGTSGNDDGLGIVPIEKAMQMVQESIRPRKEQLRKRFGELLDLCLTESDIELVENNIEQLISTNLLQ